MPKKTLWRPSPKRAYKPRDKALTSSMMSAVKNKDSVAEVMLRRELWRRGFRYRLHGKSLLGKPDLVFAAARTVVFVDGDYWHGRGIIEDGINAFSATMRTERRAWWISKLERNIARDKKVTSELTNLGWRVLRFWESDIKADVEAVADGVQRVLRRGFASSAAG
jgi:DNA mismatch endonuclease (patch repair protein)